MKIIILYSNNSSKIIKKAIYIKNRLNQNSQTLIKLININTLKNKFVEKIDVYIIMTNNIAEFLMCKEYINNYSKILIITESTNTSFILNCVDTTKNLLYLGVNINVILKKIYEISLENKIINDC